MQIHDELRRYWDHDAASYDHAGDHVASTPSEQAAWRAILAGFLPDAPSKILDVGAGTGFLSLTAAALGHNVTALDISSVMLERLQQKAAALDLNITTVHGPADNPPPGPFDTIVERHLIWTLPEPEKTVSTWRSVAPQGRLFAVEGIWGGSDRREQLRHRLRNGVKWLRRVPPAHHCPYPESVRTQLPFTEGLHPDEAAATIEAAGWPNVRLYRLRDVEWARSLALPSFERMLGVPPVYGLAAG